MVVKDSLTTITRKYRQSVWRSSESCGSFAGKIFEIYVIVILLKWDSRDYGHYSEPVEIVNVCKSS